MVTEPALCLLFNAKPVPVEFVLPPSPAGQPWRVAVDIARAPTRDISEPGGEPALREPVRYRMEHRSLVILTRGWMRGGGEKPGCGEFGSDKAGATCCDVRKRQ